MQVGSDLPDGMADVNTKTSDTRVKTGDPAQIFPLDGNPVPPGLVASHLMTPDGVRLRCAVIRTSIMPCKGTIIALHGRNECIEKYFETAADLNAMGFDVLTFDWRGQGGSQRLIKDPMRGHVRRFTDYLVDLDAVFQDLALPDCRGPFFIVAHSTGALIALLAAPDMLNRVERMVLLAPFLGMKGQRLSTGAAGRLAAFLRFFGLGRIYMAGGPRPREIRPFDGNLLTSDPKRYGRNAALYQKHPHLALGGPTASWVAGSVAAMRAIARRGRSPAPRQRMPILMLAAGNDRIVENAAIDEAARDLGGVTVLRIEGARHEILQEKDRFRSQALAAIAAYLPGSQGHELRAEREARNAEAVKRQKAG